VCQLARASPLTIFASTLKSPSTPSVLAGFKGGKAGKDPSGLPAASWRNPEEGSLKLQVWQL
jgi:hypothetical protein